MEKIQVRKTVDDFEFSFQPSIDRSVIDDLMTLRYIHNTENVVFLDPSGVGKTHLSIALGMRAIMSDSPVYYRSISIVNGMYVEGISQNYNQVHNVRHLYNITFK